MFARISLPSLTLGEERRALGAPQELFANTRGVYHGVPLLPESPLHLTWADFHPLDRAKELRCFPLPHRKTPN